MSPRPRDHQLNHPVPLVFSPERTNAGDVQDGDTIAIGGIINETNTFGSAGVPMLHRIPILGPPSAAGMSPDNDRADCLYTPR